MLIDPEVAAESQEVVPLVRHSCGVDRRSPNLLWIDGDTPTRVGFLPDFLVLPVVAVLLVGSGDEDEPALVFLNPLEDLRGVDVVLPADRGLLADARRRDLDH